MCKRLTIIVCFFTLIFVAGCSAKRTGYTAWRGFEELKNGKNVLIFPFWISEEVKLKDFKYFAANKCGHKNFEINDLISHPFDYPSLSWIEGLIDCKTTAGKDHKTPSSKPAPKVTPNEVPIKSLTISLDEAKAQCADLGFKKGTEKFGDCVLKLSK